MANIAKSKILLIFIVFYLGGIIFGEFYLSGELFVGVVVVLVVVREVFQVVWREVGSEGSRGGLMVLVIFVMIIGIFCGWGRFLISFEAGEGHVKNLHGFNELKGCICDEVDVRDDKVKYLIEVSEVLVDGKWGDVEGKVLVNASRYPVYEYGDCMRFEGKLEAPGEIEDFDYGKYLSRYDVYSVIYRAEIYEVYGTSGSEFYKIIYGAKNRFEEKLSQIFSEPYGSFMGGLLLGSRKGIPDQLMEDFNVTGLTHIIAISGYNVALVIVVISGMFGFLSRKMKVVFSGIFVVLFVMFVGAIVSVVRAGLMGILSLMALYFGRQYAVFLGLMISAFLMTLWNPKILVYDVGFQLSFLATLGIIAYSSVLEGFFKFVPKFFAIRESLMMTLSAQIVALPIIILNFGKLSVISPIANVFVLPFIPLSMIFGFFAVMFGFVSEFLGNVFGFFGYIFLKVIIFFIETFALLEFASIEIKWFAWWMVILWWILIRRNYFS